MFSPGEYADRTCLAGAEIRSIPCRSGPRLGWIELQVKAMSQLRREAVDIIHFHGQAEGAFIGRRVKASKVLSYDYFYFRRGLRGPIHSCYRRFLGAYDALLPVSDYCRQESALLPRLSAARAGGSIRLRGARTWCLASPLRPGITSSLSSDAEQQRLSTRRRRRCCRAT